MRSAAGAFVSVGVKELARVVVEETNVLEEVKRVATVGSRGSLALNVFVVRVVFLVLRSVRIRFRSW